MGVLFVKKWTFPQRRVHYVRYQYFLFYISLIWGVAYCVVRTHPTRYPPRLRAVTPQNELGTGDRCPERFFQGAGLRAGWGQAS